MGKKNLRIGSLSRRERQIMDIVYATGSSSAQDVQDKMDDAPSYSSVRTLLNILVDKGHLRREKDGLQFIYSPTADQQQVARLEMRRVLDTFFGGSLESAVQTLIQDHEGQVSNDELGKLQRLIEEAKKSGR